MDYWFAGRTEETREDLPVLVAYEKVHQTIFAHAAPEKGANELVVEQLVRDLDALGAKKMVAKQMERIRLPLC